MSRLRVVGFSGATRRPSRTTALVQAVAREVGRRREIGFTFFDLAEIGPGFDATSRPDLPERAQAALAAIESADALIVGAPIYKGSYPGLFKHLIDFVDPGALVGRPVALVATGGGRRHALAVEHQLRPLFGFFSALTLPTSLYASDEDFQDGVLKDEVTLARAAQLAEEIATHATPRASQGSAPRLERVA